MLIMTNDKEYGFRAAVPVTGASLSSDCQGENVRGKSRNESLLHTLFGVQGPLVAMVCAVLLTPLLCKGGGGEPSIRVLSRREPFRHSGW